MAADQPGMGGLWSAKALSLAACLFVDLLLYLSWGMLMLVVVQTPGKVRYLVLLMAIFLNRTQILPVHRWGGWSCSYLMTVITATTV